MIYLLNENSEITAKVNEAPTDGANYAITDQEFDLDNYTYVVGAMDSDHHVTWMNPPKPKPAEILINNIKSLQAENDVLGQTTAQLQLENMQLNSTIDTLGQTLAQVQLDIILKGSDT